MSKIEKLFYAISKSLFRIDGTLTYDGVITDLIELGTLLADSDTDETIWYLGECEECTLGDLIVGAYWHLTEWHGGYWSDTYAAMSVLGRIFQPGMTSGPEDESTEKDVFDALAAMAEKTS